MQNKVYMFRGVHESSSLRIEATECDEVSTVPGSGWLPTLPISIADCQRRIQFASATRVIFVFRPVLGAMFIVRNVS